MWWLTVCETPDPSAAQRARVEDPVDSQRGEPMSDIKVATDFSLLFPSYHHATTGDEPQSIPFIPKRDIERQEDLSSMVSPGLIPPGTIINSGWL